MDVFYTWCASIAGVLFLGQFVLGLVGLVDDMGFDGVDTDGDLTHDGFDHGGGAFVGFFSFRAITAAITVFGLAGLGASRYYEDPVRAAIVASLTGVAVLIGVGFLVRSLYRLNSSGNVDVRGAIGQSANVYLTVPADEGGQGKITLELQGRTVEFLATTQGGELPTGSTVVVTRLLSPGVVEVAGVTESVPKGASRA